MVNRDVPLADDYEWVADPFMGLENRLSKQYIRVTRIDCDYEIPGADPSLSIPAGVFNMSTVINGIGDDDEEGDGGVGDVKNPVFSQFIMVSPDLFSFLSVNQNLLPELPYHMTAICRATGISEAGDVLTTNDSPYQIIFSDQRTDGDTTTGFETGPGTGGTPSIEPISETSSTSLVANSASEMAALEDEYL